MCRSRKLMQALAGAVCLIHAEIKFICAHPLSIAAAVDYREDLK